MTCPWQSAASFWADVIIMFKRRVRPGRASRELHLHVATISASGAGHKWWSDIAGFGSQRDGRPVHGVDLIHGRDSVTQHFHKSYPV